MHLALKSLFDMMTQSKSIQKSRGHREVQGLSLLIQMLRNGTSILLLAFPQAHSRHVQATPRAGGS
jgi:hypothetical protein